MPPKSLYKFVMDYSARGQFWMVAVTFLSFPISYLSLELPKQIIDDAIGGQDFPRVVFGYEFGQIAYLLLLCGVFFSLFVLSNAIKFLLNMLRGQTGERLLRRLRYMLVARFMELRRGDERHYTAGEVVQMVTAESQPIGDFAGDFFATPLLQTGTLIVLIGFIFVQEPNLGLAAIALLPVQAYVIPLLQARVVRLTRRRIASVRAMSEEIGENVAAIGALRAYDARGWRLAQLSDRLLENYDLRLAIFNQKFLIKFTNNVLNQITPFLFYAIGGYYAIEGDIAIGALVTVIAAHKDIQSPWRELLVYYQNQSDMSARYEALIERFSVGAVEANPAAAADAAADAASEDLAREARPPRLEVGAIAAAGGAPRIAAPERLEGPASARIVGGDESARSAVVGLLAGLDPPARGRVRLDGLDPNALSMAARSRRIAVVDRQPAFFAATLRDNLSLGLLRPPSAAADDASRRTREARATGNFAAADPTDWIDPSLIGLRDRAALDGRLLALCRALEVFDLLFDAGLDRTLGPDADPELVARILEMRGRLRAEDGRSAGLADMVELWDEDRYNDNAPLIDNLLFGAPARAPQTASQLSEDPVIRRALRATTLEADLLMLGANVIEATADLLEAVGAGSSALRDFDLYPPDLVAEYRSAAAQARRGARPTRNQSRRLLRVAFGLTPARHRLGLVDDALRARIVAARADYGRLQGFRRFDADAYLPGLSLRDNLLLGRPRLERRDRWPVIGARLRDLAAELGAEEVIARLGLGAETSARDPRLTPDRAARLAAVRALVAQPRLLLLDGPGGGASAQDAALLAAIEAAKGDAILVYTSSAAVDAAGPGTAFVIGAA